MNRNTPSAFWRQVEQSTESCWPWKGAISAAGYGKARYHGFSTRIAHIIAYSLSFGSVPNEKIVRHTCNNKLCCNPNHLVLGNHSENQIHYSLTDGRKPRSNTGVKGVSYIRARQLYQATNGGRSKTFLYRGKDFFEACCARKSWEAQQRKLLIQDHTQLRGQDT